MKLIKKFFKKSEKSNFYLFFVTVAIVMIWRGVWWLMDKFFFPSNEIVSYVFWILIWLVILFIDDWKIKELWGH